MYTINYSWYRISNPVYFNNVQISFLVAWLFVGSGAVPAGISPIHLGLNGMLLCGELSELQFHSISLKYFHTLAELYNHSLKWLWFISLITYINLYQWRVEWWLGMPYISINDGWSDGWERPGFLSRGFSLNGSCRWFFADFDRRPLLAMIVSGNINFYCSALTYTVLLYLHTADA